MQRPDAFIWDGATDGDETEAALSMCITASPAAFALVSGVLMDYALRYPNRELKEETDRPLYGIDQADRDAMIHIALEMNRRLECGGGGDETMFQLRQNPDNDCQLQQSLDGGDTWTLAFDMSLCAPRDSEDTIVNNFYSSQFNSVQNFYDHYETNYAGTVVSIYPTLVYGTGEDEDDWIDLALCHTAKQLVNALCVEALKFYDEVSGLANAVKLAAGLAAGIAALIGLVGSGGLVSPALGSLAGGATYAAAGIALGAVIGEALFQITLDFARETFEDLTARDNVACAIYVMLRQEEITQAAFADAITGLTFTGNEIGIATWVIEMMGQEATYATFMGMMDQQWRNARAGLLIDCNCGVDVPYIQYSDYSTPNTVYDTGTVNYGESTFEAVPATDTAATAYYLRLGFPSGAVRVTITATTGSLSLGDINQFETWTDHDGSVLGYTFWNFPGFGNNVTPPQVSFVDNFPSGCYTRVFFKSAVPFTMTFDIQPADC